MHVRLINLMAKVNITVQNANEIREVSNYFNQDSFVFASAIRCAFKALELGDES